MSIIPFFICKFFFGQNFCKKLLYFFHLFKSFCQKFYGFFYTVRYILVLPHALFILLHFFILNFHAFSLYSLLSKKEKVFLLYNPKHLFPLFSSKSFTYLHCTESPPLSCMLKDSESQPWKYVFRLIDNDQICFFIHKMFFAMYDHQLLSFKIPNIF